MKKTAIVTGGSRGIGFAIALKLGQIGYNVVIVATSDESAQAENYSILKENGIDYLHVKGDIGNDETRSKIVSQAVETFGGIHVLVNNAGVAPKVRADLLEMTEESYDRVMGINARGTMFLTQAVAKQMLKQEIIGEKRGTIINISSISSTVSSISRGEYCISKAAISMMTTLYADRLADEKIYVHEIRPGVIMTDMTSTVKDKYDALFNSGVFPIKRWGLPDDIAKAVAVFSNDNFLYTTGNHIDIDGGFGIQKL